MVNRRVAPGMVDTRRTRRASGRVFRGDSGLPGGIREVCGSGHAAQPEASGGNYHMLTSRRIRGLREVFGIQIGRHTSELQSHSDLVCRLLLEKKKEEPQTSRPQ